MLPTVIVLNGTSSSGKTTLALALRQALPEPYLHIQVDTFTDMLDITHPKVTKEWWTTPYVDRVLTGYLASIRALADNGNRLLVDAILSGGPGANAQNYAAALNGHTAAFIGLRCDLEICRARQLQRGAPEDTPIHQRTVHDHDIYDLELDTGTTPTDQCVARILAFFAHGPDPQAFEAIRSRSPQH